MITEKDLQEAIAECLGQRNPTSNTCIKLAAFYTIQSALFPKDNKEKAALSEYSYSAPQPVSDIIQYDGGTEFAVAANGKNQQFVLGIIEELMETIKIINPGLYSAVLRKMDGL